MRLVALCPPVLGEWEEGVLRHFVESNRHSIVGCIIDARPALPALRKLTRNLRRGRGGYVIVMAGQLLLRRRNAAKETDAFCRSHGVAFFEAADPYSDETLVWIRERRPDVLALVGGFGIVRPSLLELAPHGVLAYHHGDLRRYRGQPPGLWELYDGADEMGMTVQRLTAELDAGAPIVERRVAIRPDDTLESLLRRAYRQSEDMLFEAVSLLEDEPDALRQPLAELGPLYTLPNLRQWLLFQARTASRRARNARSS